MEAAADFAWNGYSTQERDRRWDAVRKNAQDAGVDCVLVPQCMDGRLFHLSLEQARGARSDGRFMTQMENVAVVLPADGRAPIVITEHGETNNWLPETRAASKDGLPAAWGETMAAALDELGMSGGRIGVIGMGRGKFTHGRARSGVINHGAYAEVVRRLPNATFVDGTDLTGLARYTKSDEEIACLRRGAQVAVMGAEAMAEQARPGVEEGTLYAKVMSRMLAMGSQYYPLALNSGPVEQVNYRHEDPMLGRTLGPGWLLTNEIDAVFGGLVAQEMQPFILGPVPERFKPVIEVQRELYHAGLAYMTPGREFGDLIDYVNGFADKHGMTSRILIHGRGYGDDAPILTPQDTGETFRDVRVQERNAWVWKPTVVSGDGETSFSWGGCVVITEKGGEALVPREPELASV